LPALIWKSYVSQAVNIEGYAPKEFGEPSMSPGDYGGQPYGGQDDTPTTRQPGVRPSLPERPSRPSSKPTSGNGGGTTSPGGGNDGGGNGNDGGDTGGGNDGGGNDGGIIQRPSTG
jgi:hypothetical protein